MKTVYTKYMLLAIVLFCSTGLFAQSNTSQTLPVSKEPRLSWQIKTDNNTQAVPPVHFKLNPSIKTHANASGGKVVDGADIRIFPSPNVQAEVHISINHNDPNNLLASANTLLGADKGRSFYNQGYYYSLDGGQNWSGADFMQATPLNYVVGDPSTAFAANGTAFLTSIGIDIEKGSYTYWFQKSGNGGNTWSHSKSGIDYVTLGFDKQMIAADNEKGSPYANYFYDAYTDFGFGGGEVVFNRSTDLGRTFSSPILIRNQVAGFGQGTNVQTGPNGEVYVCWADHDSLVFPYRADALGFARSLDGGASFTTSRRVFSYSGTRTFGIDSTYNYVRIADFPAMAVDKSTGHNKGRIYVTYPTFNGDMTKSIIQVRWSDDKGTTWSAPVNVSIPKAKQSFFPWIACDDTNGDVWVVYFAFDTKTAYETNTYVALSTDGGASWDNQKVSDVSHITEPINNTYFASGYEGDYIGITAYGGKAYAAWQDQRNGTWQVYVSPLSKAAGTQNIITENTNLKVSPNPFNGNIKYSLSKGTIGKIELVNASGTVLKRWEGVNSNSLNVGDVQRGTYVLKVTTADAKVYSQTIIKE